MTDFPAELIKSVRENVHIAVHTNAYKAMHDSTMFVVKGEEYLVEYTFMPKLIQVYVDVRITRMNDKRPTMTQTFKARKSPF